MALVATAGASNANSYLTVEEAQDYFDTRPGMPEWDDADSQEALLIMATRVLDMMLTPYRRFIPASSADSAHYVTRMAWTGSPTDGVQALGWPRTGMKNRNGFDIASDAIPQELKNAVAELAGQLAKSDRTLDDDVSVKGISSVRAGSVAISFQNRADAGEATTKILPDAVLFLLVPSWLSQEIIEYVNTALFDVL